MRPPDTSNGPVETVRIVNNQRPGPTGGSSGFRMSPTEVGPLNPVGEAPFRMSPTGDRPFNPAVEAPDWRRPPSPVSDNVNPSSGTDLTAMREYETNLIDDLKLLQRRRDALDESFAKSEINEENYRTNVENNELQMRDAYMVLQQIQDGIREFLGLPVQGPLITNVPGSDMPLTGDPQLDGPATASNIPLGTPTIPTSGLGPNDGLTPELRRFLQSTSPGNQPLPTRGMSGIQTTNQQLPVAGQPLSPEEEITFLQSEIDQIKNANAELLASLRDLRMPNNGLSNAEIPSSFDNDLRRLQNLEDTLMPGDGRNLPTPSPGLAGSGFTQPLDPYLEVNMPNTVDSSSDSGVRGLQQNLQDGTRMSEIGRDLPNPSRGVAGSGFTQPFDPNLEFNMPNLIDPTVSDNGVDGLDQNDLSGLQNDLPPNTNIRDYMNNLVNEYRNLNQREKYILRILNSPTSPEGLPIDPISNEFELRQSNIRNIDVPQPRRNQDRIVPSTINDIDQNGQLEPIPFNAPLPNDPIIPAEDNNDVIRRDETLPAITASTQSDPLLINNLLSEYNRLNQREQEIIRILNRRERPTSFIGNDGLDINAPSPRREVDRSTSIDNPFINRDTRSRRLPNIQAGNILRDTIGPLSGELERSVPEFNRQVPTANPSVNRDALVNDRGSRLLQSGNIDPMMFNRDPLRRRLQNIQAGSILPDNVNALSREINRPEPIANPSVNRDALMDERGRMLFDSSFPTSDDINPIMFERDPLRRRLQNTQEGNGLRDIMSPVSGNVGLNVDDRNRFSQQRPILDDVIPLRNRELRPNIGTSAVVPTTGESQSTRTDTLDRNLIYNDGTITMESVRYDLPSDAVEEPVPMGSDSSLTSGFPVSGFSSQASGLLTSRTDSFGMPNQRSQFSRTREMYPIRNRFFSQLNRRQALQGSSASSRPVVSLF